MAHSSREHTMALVDLPERSSSAATAVVAAVLIAALCAPFAALGATASSSASSALAPARAAPAPVSDAEARAVRAVVQAQLKAMAADDARAAFGYAAPAIRDMYGTADNFLAMVRSAYPMVYRPASVQFQKPARQASGEIFQDVRLVDAEGVAWLATYSLDRQKDGAWRITGCVVGQIKGRTV